MSWYEWGMIKEMTDGLTQLGYYGILGPMTAGLTNGVYVNWCSAKEDPDKRKLLFCLSSYALPQDLDDLQTTMFGVFPKRKYLDFLKRVNLDAVDKSDLVTPENFLEFLSDVQSKEVVKLRIWRKALDPTLALSFSWPNRLMSVRMTPYLLWSAMFRGQNSKVDLKTLKAELLKRTVDVGDHQLFPMWRQFLLLDEIRGRELFSIPLSRKRRLHYQWVSPFYLAGDHQSHVKDVLREIWYKLRSKTLSSKRVLHYWTLINQDIPFLRAEGPRESLLSSPFKSLDQLLSYLESYAESNKPVKLLARGHVDEVGQSVLKLARFNISPLLHYRLTEDDSPGKAELLLMEAIDAGRGPVIDPRLSASIVAMEDRTKAWYEVLYNTDADYANTVMYEDLREFLRKQFATRRISISVAKTSSTGSQRLDDLRWKFLLLAGMCTLSEAWHGLRFANLWLTPEYYENEVFHGEYDVIKKKEDLVIQMTYKNKELRAKANRPEKVVRRLIKTMAFDSIDFTELRIPDGEVIGISQVKGSRMMVISCEDGKERYMSVPEAHIRLTDQMRSIRGEWLPAHVERWLQREALSEDEFADLVLDCYSKTPTTNLSKSMIQCAGRLARGRMPIQVRERLATVREHLQTVPEDIEEQILGFAIELKEALGDDESFDPDDWLTNDWLGGGEGGVEEIERMGLEAFAIEETFTTIEINRTIRDLLRRLEVLHNFPPHLFSSSLNHCIEIYNKSRVD